MSKTDRRFAVFLGQQYPLESVAGESVYEGGAINTDWLEPLYASSTCNGEIGELRLLAHKLPEDVWNVVKHGQQVYVDDFKDEEDGVTVFSGVIVKKHAVIQGNQTKFEIICYNNADNFLRRKVLHGQVRRTNTKEQDYYDHGLQPAITLTIDDLPTIDTPLIFNPNGEPNMSEQTYFLNTDTNEDNEFHIFDVPFRNQVNSASTPLKSLPWTLSQAVIYLLTLNKANWILNNNSYGSHTLQTFFDTHDPVVSNVNCEGCTLMEALTKLLTPYNFVFWCSMAPGDDGQHHDINFAFRGEGPQKTVRLAPRGTLSGTLDDNDKTSNAISIDILEDSTAAINAIQSYGERVVVTTLAQTSPYPGDNTLFLVPGWKDQPRTMAGGNVASDGDLTWYYGFGGELNTYDIEFRRKYCNPELITKIGDKGVYGIGRVWIINLGEQPLYPLEDLTTDLGGHNSIDPRRLEKPEFYDQNYVGGLLHQDDTVVEMSFDNGQNWDIVERHWYRVLSEELGIVFTNPREMEILGIHFANNDVASGKNYWQALHDKKLQIRILCGIKSDQRVNAHTLNIGTTTPLAAEGLVDNKGYRKFTFNDAVFGGIYYTKFPPFQPTVDDTTQLQDLTNDATNQTDRMLIHGTISVVLGDFNEYDPGDTLDEIENRTIQIADPAPTVVRVVYDFQSQHVHLTLDNRRVSSVLKARPVRTDQDYREHKLGIENIRPIQGGHQVPYLPGVQQSMEEYYREGGQ